MTPDIQALIEQVRALQHACVTTATIDEVLDALVDALEQFQWRDIASAPRDESYGSFDVLLPGNDAAKYLVVQVSMFEGRMLPDAMDLCVSYDDGVTNATHWRQSSPLPPTPKPVREG